MTAVMSGFGPMPTSRNIVLHVGCKGQTGLDRGVAQIDANAPFLDLKQGDAAARAWNITSHSLDPLFKQ
jgi:hypothetical protein